MNDRILKGVSSYLEEITGKCFMRLAEWVLKTSIYQVWTDNEE